MGITAAVTAGAAVVSAGTAAYGIYEQNQGRQSAVEAAQTQATISGQMAQTSASFAGSEYALNVAAADASVTASEASSVINKNILQGEQGIEGLKRQAMESDARRKQLEFIRQQQRARSLGLTKQGAQFGSGLQGGYGQISGATGTNLTGLSQNLQIGEGIFDFNAGITNQRIALNDLMTQYQKTQAGFQTQGAQLKYQSAQAQANLQTQYSAAGGQMATGQGQQQFGSSIAGLAPSIFAVGQVGGRFAQTAFGPSTASTTPDQALNMSLFPQYGTG